jgi:hypothetical protein
MTNKNIIFDKLASIERTKILNLYGYNGKLIFDNADLYLQLWHEYGQIFQYCQVNLAYFLNDFLYDFLYA